MAHTGPLPAVELEVPGTSDSAARMAALVMMGSPFSRGVWRSYRTADAVIDTEKGVLFIAVDLECDPGDWAAIVDLIRIVGWDNGTRPNGDDPGEPAFDALAGVWTWRLEYARLRYAQVSARSLLTLSQGPGAFSCPYPVAAMMRTR